MELLAPVGSKESFVTAIRAGANAVYMGVPDFNARVSAANISLYDLQVLIAHAHEKGVKVFLALNTLIKHEEINSVVKNLTYVAQLNPDAVIVQDLGIASIIKNYFPALELHASTQMAVHNRMGVDFLARNGFKRAILARELSFSELKGIAKSSPIPIEIFCHGALCFSLSGMCLFSSFIGGLSGNRGRCTQPCRRLWVNGGKQGYIFSPRDMEFAEYINKLKSIGIASLKIEGRMRSSEYVYKVVKAYRLLLDAPEADAPRALAEAKAILATDSAREKTSCLFSGRDPEIFQPKKAQCLGNLVGTISAIRDGNLHIAMHGDTTIADGDRLRLSNPATDTTIAFKIKEFTKQGSTYVIPFGKADEFACGNPVYKTIDAATDQKDIEKDIDAIYAHFAETNRRAKKIDDQPSQTYTALISNKWKEIKKMAAPATAEDTLWVKFDNAQWLDLLPLGKDIRCVYYLTKENLHLSDKLPSNRVAELVGELPPFIGQRETALYKQCIDKMIARGVKKWVLNNVSQFEYFKDSGCELSSGPFLYTWNAYTAAFLTDLGVTYFTTSWEDDFLNIRKMSGPGMGKYMVVYLYGYVPVVRSRIITREMLTDEPITEYVPPSQSAEKNTLATFLPVFESEQALLIPDQPVNIFTARKKLNECGIRNFGIDLSFIKPDKRSWNVIIEAYQQHENLLDTLKFNFKRGIK